VAPRWLVRIERGLSSLAGLRGFDPDRVMRCEEYPEPGCLVVRAELPGVDPDEDVEVAMVGGMLRIRAHRRDEHRGRRGAGARTEFFYGEMVRTLSLPARADVEGATAWYDDGILEVIVPVDDAPAQDRRVPVMRGSRSAP
jgi:HSP20 family protein